MKNRIIQAIDTKSNAYKAGLRNDQKIISFDIPKGVGNPDQIITFRTVEGTFYFKPEHWYKIEVYQLKLKMSVKERREFDGFFNIK